MSYCYDSYVVGAKILKIGVRDLIVYLMIDAIFVLYRQYLLYLAGLM